MRMRVWSITHWKQPTKISVTEPEGVHSYRVIADFWMTRVNEEEALAHASIFVHAREIRAALVELVDQIKRSGAVDDHGHSLLYLQALADADVLLGEAIDA